MNATLPVLYRSEYGTGDWLTLPRRCPTCTGLLYDDRQTDSVACMLCARSVALVEDERKVPLQLSMEDDAPRRGRPRTRSGRANKQCDDCGGPIYHSSDQRCWSCYRASIAVPPRYEWPPCVVEGCGRLRKTYHRGLCGKHTLIERNARRSGVTV